MKKIIRMALCFTTFLTGNVYAESMTQFIQQVVQSNPAIQAAESNLSAAKSREIALGKSLYNPELTAEQQNSVENTTSVGINQTIDWADKREARKQVGTANVLLAKAQLADLKQQLILAIFTALSQYHIQQQAIVLAKKRTNMLQQLLQLTQKGYEKGDLARVDLDLARLALSEAIAQQADAEVNANQALQILRATTGMNQANWPFLPNQLPLLRSSTQTNVDNLLMNLPAMLVLNQQFQAAKANIKVAERNRYADPTIGIQGGESSEEGDRKRLIGVTLSIPLFVLNPYRAEVDAANYDAMEAEGQRMNMVRQAKANMTSSMERYQILYRSYAEWQKYSAHALNGGTVVIRRLWQSGEISTTDYLIQLKQRIDSQMAGIALKGRAWEAWSEWLKSSGQAANWLHLSSLMGRDMT